MTKSKSSTIAIVVLSVLLAAALASTIVLAAFTQTRTATTTITFSNGITLNVGGITAKVSPATDYAWNMTVGGTANTSGELSNVNGDANVSLDAITVAVTGMDAYVAVKATLTESTSTDDVAPALQSGWVAASSTNIPSYAKTGWVVYGTASAATALTAGAEASTVYSATEIFNTSSDNVNDFASRVYTGTVKVAASDTVAGLLTLINQLDAA